MEVASSEPRVGEVLDDRYRIIEPLASGGMGVVYRAERLGLGRFVAVKFLSDAGATSDQSIKRFEREARAMSRLNHPHVVSVIDFGIAKTPYIVMEYVTGRPLHELIALGPADAKRVIHIMRQLLAGLAHAHGQGIIHRDIKPANVMLTEATGTGDYVRILDFGLAKLKGAASLSSTNIVVGTPSYMAPEQSRGQEEDGRSDVYASGVLFYELLKGDKPFVGTDALQTLRMHQKDPIPPLGRVRGAPPELAAAIEDVVRRAMAKDPDDRFQSALEMGEALSDLAVRASSESGAAGKGRRRQKKATDVGRARTMPIETADLSIFDPPEVTEPVERQSAPPPSPPPSPEPPPPPRPEPELEPAPQRSSRAGSLFMLLLLVAGGAWGYRWWQRQQQAEPGAVTAARPIERVNAAEPAGLDAGTAAVAASLDASIAPVLDAAPAPGDAAIGMFLFDAGVPSDALLAAGLADAGVLADAGALDPDEVPESESAEIADAGPPDAAAPPPPRPASVERWADVKALLARGEQDAAVAGLRKLVREHPKNAFYKLRLAHLYFERTAWTSALKLYRTALRLEPRYKRYKSVNTNAIRALGAPSTRWRAHALITRTIGRRIALPHLRREARINKSPVVRKRAAALVKRFR